MDARILD